MGKKEEVTKKKKLKRAIAKEDRKRPNKKKQKIKKNLKPKKNKNKDNYSQNEEDNDESLKDFILPGQNFSTPPAGDATRAFYESLLEQRPDSMMAKKYCVEYGCLEPDKAIEYAKEIEKKKKKK